MFARCACRSCLARLAASAPGEALVDDSNNLPPRIRSQSNHHKSGPTKLCITSAGHDRCSGGSHSNGRFPKCDFDNLDCMV
eukprot:6109240-Amphidinium_carterae.1